MLGFMAQPCRYCSGQCNARKRSNSCAVPALLSCTTAEIRIPSVPERGNTLCRICRLRSWCFYWGSRYCETDRLSETAWQLFGHIPTGWERVQGICDFVNSHVAFNYADARPTRTAWETFNERRGVCRDFTHLAVTFCRCMNIPAQYCTGYLGDLRVPPPYVPMGFAAWFEAYLDGARHVFDPRNNTPRIGRVLKARWRDAVDVPISNTFGPNTLKSFKVWTDEDKQGQSIRPK
jgi:transglutaminase-like putative cysteine protease